LDRDRRYGGRRHRHVRDMGKLIRPPNDHTEFGKETRAKVAGAGLALKEDSARGSAEQPVLPRMGVA
jgi:hypothetical protein